MATHTKADLIPTHSPSGATVYCRAHRGFTPAPGELIIPSTDFFKPREHDRYIEEARRGPLQYLGALGFLGLRTTDNGGIWLQDLWGPQGERLGGLNPYFERAVAERYPERLADRLSSGPDKAAIITVEGFELAGGSAPHFTGEEPEVPSDQEYLPRDGSLLVMVAWNMGTVVRPNSVDVDRSFLPPLDPYSGNVITGRYG